MTSKGTALAIGLGVLTIGGIALAAASNGSGVKYDDLFVPKPLPTPDAWKGLEPISRNRVVAKSTWQYDVLGWRKLDTGEDYYVAVVVRPADFKGEDQWIAYIRDKDGKRKLHKAGAPDDGQYKRMAADFGVG